MDRVVSNFNWRQSQQQRFKNGHTPRSRRWVATTCSRYAELRQLSEFPDKRLDPRHSGTGYLRWTTFLKRINFRLSTSFAGMRLSKIKMGVAATSISQRPETLPGGSIPRPSANPHKMKNVLKLKGIDEQEQNTTVINSAMHVEEQLFAPLRYSATILQGMKKKYAQAKKRDTDTMNADHGNHK